MPTGDARVAKTMAGISSDAAELNQVSAEKPPAPDGRAAADAGRHGARPPPLRDRAPILVGFARALRRCELASIQFEQMYESDKGLMLALPGPKSDRDGKGVLVPLPFGVTELCPVRALRLWLWAAEITPGTVFRRVWRRSTRKRGLDVA